MRLNNATVAGLFCTLASFLLAQEPIPSALPAVASGAVQPAVPAGREPAGYLRAWDFVQLFKDPVELGLSGAGTAPVTLAYAAKPGQLGSYRRLRPGRYRMSVRNANPDALKPGGASVPTNRNPELMPAVSVEVADGSFQTLVLRDDQSGPKVALINDSIAPGTPGKRLRVFNFAAGEPPALKVLSTDEMLWPQIPAGMSEHFFPKDTKTVNLAMIAKLPNGRESRQIVEADFSSAPAVSIAIFADRDGTFGLQSFSDAKE